MGLWDKITFNPNLRPNDSLSPEEISKRVNERNEETRGMTEDAYLTGGVPESAAARAADHSSVERQTNEAKKARRDAETWYEAKNENSRRTRHMRRCD